MKKEKWLLRRMSRSRAEYHYRPGYSDSRGIHKNKAAYLPQKEPMGKGNTYLDTGLVKRWLYSQIGKDFDQVYSAFLKRIQPKYLAGYRDCIYYYVLKKEEILLAEDQDTLRRFSTFYIDPVTNLLGRFPDVAPNNERVRKSRYCFFRYEDDRQKWVMNYSNYFTEIVVHKSLDQFEITDLSQVEFYLKNQQCLKEKANALVDKKLKTVGLGFSLNNPKFHTGLYFADPENLDNFYLEIKVLMLDDYLWKIDFNKLEALNIEQIKY